MNLDLTPQELTVLDETLESALENIREQVHHAEDPVYKDSLKADEALLRKMIQKVRALLPAEAAAV